MKSKSQPDGAKPLPFIATFDDAERLYQTEKDPFYLAAFLCQLWLGTLLQRATAEYAEKKNPRDRSLQNGEAWREFLALFNPKSEKSYALLLSCLLRFSASDNSAGNSLRRALVPLSIEHHIMGPPVREKDLKLPLTPDPSPGGRGEPRALLHRWCEWLEAQIHLRIHRRWHATPACFHPDAETRHLAALGHAQRHIASLDLRGQIAWAHDFVAAANLFRDSPKWEALGKGMSHDSDRLWKYAEVDTLVIALWPLVKRYRWTYRDLLNVIRLGLKRSGAYPCGREQDFATYCANVLGLRKTGRGRSAKDGRPEGYEIARRWYLGIEQKETKQTKTV